MWKSILDFIGWTDPTRRAALVRAAVAAVGYGINNGTIKLPPFVYDIISNPGMATMVGALLIPAGQKNAT